MIAPLKKILLSAAALSLAVAVGCSTDSPTEPRQTPPPNPGTNPVTSWQITVTANPIGLLVGSASPTTINIQVRRADNGQPPPNGTTAIVRTTLGEFFSLGSGDQDDFVTLVNGNAQIQLFPGSLAGTAQVTVQLENSVGGVNVPIQALVVNSVTPNTGRPEGGELVTLAGQGFVAPVRVEFGDASTTEPEVQAEVVSVAADRIVIRTPPLQDLPFATLNEPLDVIVTAAVGSGAEVQYVVNGGFTYVSDFFVDRLEPRIGSADGGETVVIIGAGFAEPVRVVFEDIPGTSAVSADVLSVTDTRITIRTPSVNIAAGGEVAADVRVTINVNEGGEVTDVLEDGFTFVADPFFISHVQPNRGPETGGPTVSIFGSGFEDPVRVSFGGVNAVVLTSSATRIDVRLPARDVPDGTDEAVDVSVTINVNQGGLERVDTLSGGFTYESDPSQSFFISSVSPNEGSPAGGETVTIFGSAFDSPLRVSFGGRTAQVVGFTPTSITVVTPSFDVPAGETRPVDVTVTINFNEANQATDTLPNGFTYTFGGSTSQPTVLSVSPASGPNEGGTIVRIIGSGFDSPVQVFFGEGTVDAFLGIEATVRSVTANELVVVAPAATGFGQDNRNETVDILVRNLESGLATVANQRYRYGIAVLITSIAPAEGPYTGGTIVTIFGQGFDEPVAVSMGGVGQQIISVTGTEIIIRTVPVDLNSCADVSGPTQVVNIESGLGDPNGPDFTYRVIEPLLFGLSPTSGPQAGGNTVTITGSGFVSPRIEFGTQTAVVQTVSGTTIVVTAPPFTGTLRTESCDDNGDGTAGTRNLPTSVDVSIEDLVTGCTDTLTLAYTYNPTDPTCRGDVGPVDPPDPVVAEFSFFVAPAGSNNAQFVDESTGPILQWQWDFTNDGTFDSAAQNPQFNFGAPGTYSTRLRVTGLSGFDEDVEAVTVP